MMGHFLPGTKTRALDLPQLVLKKNAFKEKPQEVNKIDDNSKMKLRYGNLSYMIWMHQNLNFQSNGYVIWMVPCFDVIAHETLSYDTSSFSELVRLSWTDLIKSKLLISDNVFVGSIVGSLLSFCNSIAWIKKLMNWKDNLKSVTGVSKPKYQYSVLGKILGIGLVELHYRFFCVVVVSNGKWINSIMVGIENDQGLMVLRLHTSFDVIKSDKSFKVFEVSCSDVILCVVLRNAITSCYGCSSSITNRMIYSYNVTLKTSETADLVGATTVIQIAMEHLNVVQVHRSLVLMLTLSKGFHVGDLVDTNFVSNCRGFEPAMTGEKETSTLVTFGINVPLCLLLVFASILLLLE